MGYFYRKKRIIIRNVGEFFRILSDAVDRARKSGYNKRDGFLLAARCASCAPGKEAHGEAALRAG